MREEIQITESFRAAQPPPVPPPPRPPRALLDDAWPWLALLALLAVAGLLVWLFVLRDRTAAQHTVPAVVGMQQQEALAKLTSDGYTVHAIVEPADRPPGVVAAQAPGGGARLDPGGTVTLRVSNGRAVTVTTAPARTATLAATLAAPATQSTLPDVTGQDMVTGAGQIEAAGFVAETRPVDSTQPEGIVTSETPAAGAQAPAGSTVVLEVAVGSSRPARRAPSVVGQKAAAARAALLQAGLTVRTQYRKAGPRYLGVVVAQSPAGGASAAAYTQAVVTVGR